MNLLTNCITNNNKTILRFNIYIIILLDIILSGGTFLFFNKPLGIIFGVMSILHLIMIFVLKNKIKNIKYEKPSI